ncbi:MAG: hypothetical protein U1C96_02500 [Gallionella sp.]|nr:hypothetical protein [Gallionella sp.]
MKKKLAVLAVLAALTGIAVAASTRDAETAPAVPANPHGTMASKPGAATSPHGGGMPASGHPAVIPADVSLVNSGKVLEVIDSPAYTYIQVTTDKGPLWLAAYKQNVSKGATVKYSSGIAMPRFHSKSLNRTFDEIVFVDSLEVVKK